MSNNSELHLMIIWNNALGMKNEILKDLEKDFIIRNKFYIKWSDENFSLNLSRFYGENLPSGSNKEKICGIGKFLLLILEDKNPVYKLRKTLHGLDSVNANLFDKKMKYRGYFNNESKIHATNSVRETNHDLTLLLGKNIEDFLKKYKPSKKEEEINADIIGANGWNNLDEIFYVLNNCTNYVVLRDFDNNLKELYDNEDYDADILFSNEKEARFLLNAELEYKNNKKTYCTILNHKKCYFDIKYVGDNYYCEKLELDLLDNKILKNNFYIPSENYYYNSLLYHALVHKNNFETKYNKKLGDLFSNYDKDKPKEYYINLLSDWMIKNEYYITIPNDNYNNFNIENISKFDGSLLYYCLKDYKDTKLNETTIPEDYYFIKEKYEQIVNSKSWKLMVKIRQILRRK